MREQPSLELLDFLGSFDDEGGWVDPFELLATDDDEDQTAEITEHGDEN